MVTNTIRLVLILSLSILWFLANAEQSLACSCVPPDSPSEELSRSAAVFSGKVIDVREYNDPNTTTISSTDPTTIEFEVHTVWKGPSFETMYLTTPRSGASCGFTFVKDEEYIVYSHDGSEVILCSRTALLKNATSDLDELGKGTKPQPGTIAPVPVVTPLPILHPETMVPTPVATAMPVQQPTNVPEPRPTRTLLSSPLPVWTATPTPQSTAANSQEGGGCGLGSATADATWLGIMAGLVWFGVRRRPRP